MTKSLFRALVALAGAALVSAASLPASAATLTYNDPNCASFQITGSGGSYTLSCAKLTCSLVAAPAAPTTAQDTSLQATCTSNGVAPVGIPSYVFSLVTGPFSDATCSALQSPTTNPSPAVKPSGILPGNTRTCLYQVTANASQLSGQAMVSVTWSDAAPVAPVCTPSLTTVPSPMTNAGGSVNLSANCAPSAGVTYTWTRIAPTVGAPTNPTSATPTDTLAANANASSVMYTWQVKGCTSPTTCDTKTVTTNVPGTGVAVSCTGFSSTVFVDLAAGWETSPQSFHTYTMGNFKSDGALVIKLGPPAGTQSPYNNPGSIFIGEEFDNLTNRFTIISTTPCDFTNPSAAYGTIIPVKDVASTISRGLSVNQLQAGVTNLIAGQTYYISIKNTQSDGVTPSCATSTCNMIINWTKPPGT